MNEEKTAVYVLSKKADAPIVETFVQEPVTTTSKPGVVFIKYRTNEEAEHAQHHIQADTIVWAVAQPSQMRVFLLLNQ